MRCIDPSGSLPRGGLGLPTHLFGHSLVHLEHSRTTGFPPLFTPTPISSPSWDFHHLQAAHFPLVSSRGRAEEPHRPRWVGNLDQHIVDQDQVEARTATAVLGTASQLGETHNHHLGASPAG